MKNNKRLIAVCLALLFPANTVLGQCFNGWTMPDEWDSMPIPVYLNSQLDEDICPSSTCSGMNDIRRTVEAALDEFYHKTGGKLRFVYAGETSEPRHAIIDGAIHVFSNDCNGGTLAIAAFGSDGGDYGGKIRMCRTNGGGNSIAWDSFDRIGARSFYGVFLHEVGHLVGMDHIEACAGTTVERSIMHASVNSTVSSHLQRPDIRHVHLEWGTRETIGRPKWTSRATSWSDGGGTPPFHSNRVLGRFAATNTATSGNNVYVAWADWTMAVLWVSRYTPANWDIQSGFFEAVNYHPGIASSGDNVLLTWLGNRDRATGLQDILSKESSDGGLTFGPDVLVSDPNTRTANAGTSATFDPESGAFISLWRGTGSDENEILYRVLDGANPPWKIAGTLAADTPSMACGPSALVGDFNCLIAWTEANHWQRPTRWTQARVMANGQLELQPIKTHGYVTFGAPSVAYTGYRLYPWIIALTQGGSSTYTWRKRAPHANNFEDERSFSFRPKVTVPAAGSRLRNGDGRGYVFTTDE